MNNNLHQSSGKNYSIVFFAIMLFISFILVVSASTVLLSSYKADLTQDKRNTISDNTQAILKKLQNPVYINVYLSANLAQEYPQYANYSQFVLRYLDAYSKLSHGLIKIDVKNPEPYSATEKDAKDNGIQGFLDNNGKYNLYFGAVFSNDRGDSITIPNFVELRKNYLEQDISRTIFKLSLEQEEKTIAVVSPLTAVMSKSYGVTSSSNWTFINQLKKNYNVVSLSPNTLEIPVDVDVLILFNPQKLSDIFKYALDQYVMRGGHILILADPFAEYEKDNNGLPSANNPNMNKLFNNWGVSFEDNQIVGDINLAQSLLFNNNQNEKIEKYAVWLTIPEQNINQENIISKNITKLDLKSAGSIDIINNDSRVTPLVITTSEAGRVPAHIAKYTDKENTMRLYQTENKQFNLAVLIEGNFKSIYEKSLFEGSKIENDLFPYIPVSVDPAKIIIITDTDLVYNNNWVSEDYSSDDAYGIIPINNNYDLIQKAVDYLAGNNDILSISYKSIKNNSESVSDIINDKVTSMYKDQLTSAENKLKADEIELQKIKDSIAKKESSLSIKTLKQVEDLQRRVSIDKENMQHLEYKIKQENAAQTSYVIILNTFVFPLSLIFLIWLINIIVKKKSQKKVLELLNEHKDA